MLQTTRLRRLYKLLGNNDYREAELVHHYMNALSRKSQLCCIEQTIAINNFQIQQVQTRHHDESLLYVFKCNVPKHSELMKLATFTHFASESIKEIEMVVGGVRIPFQSIKQVSLFLIPMVNLTFSTVTLRVISSATPMAHGSCTWETFYISSNPLRDEILAKSAWWPVDEQRVCGVAGGFALRCCNADEIVE